jgi:hypothetical protein
MPVKVQLLRNNRVMLFTYSSPLTTAEAVSASQSYRSARDRASAPLLTIHDLSRVSNLPQSVLSLARSRCFDRVRHPMEGVMVIVTHSSFIKALAGAVLRLIPGLEMRVVETMDQAWATVESILAEEVRA